MKIEPLFQRFDDLVDSPERIPALRKVILAYLLHAAVNSPEASSRAQTMREAHELRRRELIENANRKEVPPVPAVLEEDLPPSLSDIPAALFDRLGNIASIEKGLSPIQRTNPGKYPLVVTAETRSTSDSYDFEGPAAIIPMVSSTGHGHASLKRLHYQEGQYAVGNILSVVQPVCPELIRARFLYEYLSAFKEELLVSRMVGTANVSLTVNKLSEIPVPLVSGPILSRIDELMALCDRLEAQLRERDTRHPALASMLLARFADTPIAANLDFLFHDSFDIAPVDLRKTILTLAVQGKLAPQEPNDEPASVLLSQIGAEKRQLVLERKIRQQEEAKPISKDELPFEVPAGWEWARLSSITRRIHYGFTASAKPEIKDVRLLRITDIQDNLVDWSAVPGCDIARDDIPHYQLERGDILVARTGGTVGKTYLIRDVPVSAVFASYLIRIQSASALFDRYLKLFLESPTYWVQLEEGARGAAQPNVNGQTLGRMVVSVPPVAEQRRIVAKVDQLMALVDQLETKLASSHATAGNFLEALVAAFTGTRKESDQPKSPGGVTPMKKKTDDSPERRALMLPLKFSTKRFVLRRFAMESGYRSLGNFDSGYHSTESGSDEASPICLVGLNGSGKSNLIEAIAEVFCFLELINLPWSKVEKASSTYRKNRHIFELEYTLEDTHGKRLIRIKKTKKTGAEFFIVAKDGSEKPVKPGRDQLSLLPRRVIGYSSGLNETVSHPFLRTKTIYSEEVRDAAPPEGVAQSTNDEVFDTRTLYMDYESNAAVIISNYIFQEPKQLAVFNTFTRVCGVSSFGLRFNRKRAGKSGPNKFVRLTRELKSFIRSFARCAGKEYDENQIECSVDFQLTPKTAALFRKEFKTAENLFMAMHKWSLLNALILSDEQRNVYLSSDITKGALERPPSVPPSDRVFNIVDLKLKLSTPQIEIDYSGLSDGEHQFMQVFGTALLFSAPGALFLLDEPESHFNPEWRTQFNLILNRLPNASRQEYMISTHSPFIVSGSRKENVYKFKRDGAKVEFAQVGFETYGASFDVLLNKLFDIDSMIDQSARNELEDIIKRGAKSEMSDAVQDFAESREKRRLYEAIIKKEKKAKKKK